MIRFVHYSVTHTLRSTRPPGIPEPPPKSHAKSCVGGGSVQKLGVPPPDPLWLRPCLILLRKSIYGMVPIGSVHIVKLQRLIVYDTGLNTGRDGNVTSHKV